jgi:hypothetical protein
VTHGSTLKNDVPLAAPRNKHWRYQCNVLAVDRVTAAISRKPVVTNARSAASSMSAFPLATGSQTWPDGSFVPLSSAITSSARVSNVGGIFKSDVTKRKAARRQFFESKTVDRRQTYTSPSPVIHLYGVKAKPTYFLSRR